MRATIMAALLATLSVTGAIAQEEAAPDTAACEKGFDPVRDASKIRNKIHRLEHAAPQDARVLRTGLAQYAMCSALARRDSGLCGAFSAVPEFDRDGPRLCRKQFDNLAFWDGLDTPLASGQPVVSKECADLASPGQAEPLCKALRAGWAGRDHALCGRLEPLMGKKKSTCRQYFGQIDAPTFRVVPGQPESEIFQQAMVHQLWQGRRPDCERFPYFGAKNEPTTKLLRKASCQGVFYPEQCDALVAPVRDFYCSHGAATRWRLKRNSH